MSTRFPYLSTEAAANALGLTTGRLRQMLIAGKLKGTKVGDRAWAIPVEEIRRLKRQKKTSAKRRNS